MRRGRAEGGGGRGREGKHFFKTRNCQQMGTAPTKVLHWQAEGLPRKRAKEGVKISLQIKPNPHCSGAH